MSKKALSALKKALQRGRPAALERLASDLLGQLIGTRFTVARSGFQHGADAGTVGRERRHLRMECKRYADRNPLDDRNLQGGIDDALRRDDALEAWILVATRAVGQQTEDVLRAKAVATGVPVVVIDWRDDTVDLPTLAALCAWAPDIVGKHYGKSAMMLAESMARLAKPTVERLGRELAPWAIGYEGVLEQTRTSFTRLWSDPTESRSRFGQNVAGAAAKAIPRRAVESGLDSWWVASKGNLAVVHGAEGMGKTWAVAAWLAKLLSNLPIVLMFPASAFQALRYATRASIIELLGNALYEMSPGTERAYWCVRAERLLLRPPSDGPAFILLVDGLNQEPSFGWLRLLQALEGSDFAGRIRVIVTSQTHFLSERLHGLRHLSLPATKLEVGRYDLSQGGEFDALLNLHGLSRDSMTEPVIELARVPRMFELAVKKRGDANTQGVLTVGRLLWAHARDELALKERASLSESEWEAWLQELAKRYVREIRAGRPREGYSSRQLIEMTGHAALTSDETDRRLQEIVSGTWLEAVPGRPGRFRAAENTISLALGIGLLGRLEGVEQTSSADVARVLDEYLDPIRATSAAAEMLTYALSVMVEKKWPAASEVPSLILSALLHSQNASDEQRKHAVHLAPNLVGPLLQVSENSQGGTGASARHWALQALHGISPSNQTAWEEISDRLVHWVARVQCPSPEKVAADDEYAASQARRLIATIGSASPGRRLVLGVPLLLAERVDDQLGEHVPELLLGKPLMPMRAVLVAASVAVAASYPGKVWWGLKWLVTLNPLDSERLAIELAELAEVAKLVECESGVSEEYGDLVSRFLLRLTGDEKLEQKADGSPTRLQQSSYTRDYLADPANSIFSIERRHVPLLWLGKKGHVFGKLQRAKEFLADPSLTFPASLSRAIEEWGRELNPEHLYSDRQYSGEDHSFDSFLSVTAGVSRLAIGDAIARWFKTLPGREEERRRWAAGAAPRFSLLVSAEEEASLHEMRHRRPTSVGNDERMVLCHLLECELLSASVGAQLDALVREQDAFIAISLAEILRDPQPDTVRTFIHRWGLESPRAIEVLCNYLWRFPEPLEEESLGRLVQYALAAPEEQRNLVFMALSVCNPDKFGRALLERRWTAAASANDFTRDAGSRAVLAAIKGGPLTEGVSSVAPWCLLDEAVERGGLQEDMLLAVHAIEVALHLGGHSPFPGVVDVSVRAVDTRNFTSIEPSARAYEEDEGLRSWDSDTQLARYLATREAGETYLRNARLAGASMATRIVSLATAQALLDRSPTAVARWLDGLEKPTQALMSRVNLGGGLFLAICEAMLHTDAERGALLWHVLARHLRIRFVGVGGLNELLLIPFRVPASDATLKLRRHLYSLQESTSDDSYMDLALAAISQGAADWLDRTISEDEVSSKPFRQRRAIMLRGHVPTECTLASRWREGPTGGSWDQLRLAADENRNRGHFARHWWRKFLSAPDALTAFCSWQVFLTCVDKMAWAWIDADIEAYRQDDELWRRKMLHMQSNLHPLKAAMKGRSGKGMDAPSKHLVGWDSPSGWLSEGALSRSTY